MPTAARTKKTHNSRGKIAVPKTASKNSRKSKKSAKIIPAIKEYVWADSSMSKTALQNLAKSRGVAFGGLTKQALIRKLNNYY